MVLSAGLPRPSLQAVREIVGGVRGNLPAEEIERSAEPEVDVALEEGQIEDPGFLGIVVAGGHHLGGALHDASHSGLPTDMWNASSVSMKRVVRDRGSKALSASARSWYLPSRSVNMVNR